MNSIIHENLFNHMEQWAPKHIAYEWDPIGLQIGEGKNQTKNVLTSLDVTEDVVDEAIKKEVNLIIAHHPLLFKSLQEVDLETPKGKIIKKLIKHDITVYAAHTNLDIAAGGVNDLLADALSLMSKEHFIPFHDEQLYKLIVFVPNDYVEKVRDALGNAGAGYIGAYSHCTFQTAGTGTFKPLEGTNPYIGEQNKIAFVEEQKIETIVKEQDRISIIEAMKKAHPYEEVAFDVYPVQQKGASYSLGRIGYLPDEMSLQALCEKVKTIFHMDHLRFVGDPTKQVKKVAIVGGSGEKYIKDAIEQHADVYITGDINFHPAQDALAMGLALIDPGHYIEKIMIDKTKNYIQHGFPALTVFSTKVNTDPFHFI